MATIVALHGFTGGGGDFAPLAEALPEYDWVTPDLPGHAPDPAVAGAPGDDCTLEDSLRYLDVALAEKPDKPVVLLGYSLGGRLAIRFAQAQPGRIAALVLVGTSPGIENAAERTARKADDNRLAEKILAKGVTAFLDEWQRRPLIATQARLPAAWRTAMQERRLQRREEGLAASLRQFGQGVLEPAWALLAKLRMPVLLAVGAEDEKYVAENRAMQTRCPHAELFIVPNAGHLAHLENRDAFAAGLRQFLQKIK
ncbi:MAG TPA: 2-succinyl-6-hydroxy-2,4-cyclohexadiene-1-carboxylate synthase [Opitutales bacterium]|nr:2-succinyl-6-hydroxy-2,4-cyclohexadiene-1-carboxylate synthase [Opitutales bacterium]